MKQTNEPEKKFIEPPYVAYLKARWPIKNNTIPAVETAGYPYLVPTALYKPLYALPLPFTPFTPLYALLVKNSDKTSSA